MTARLYAMPASHPSIAAGLMLEHKGIEYETAWLLLPFTGRSSAYGASRGEPSRRCASDAS